MSNYCALSTGFPPSAKLDTRSLEMDEPVKADRAKNLFDS